jgi:hypothetical protein
MAISSIYYVRIRRLHDAVEEEDVEAIRSEHRGCRRVHDSGTELAQPAGWQDLNSNYFRRDIPRQEIFVINELCSKTSDSSRHHERIMHDALVNDPCDRSAQNRLGRRPQSVHRRVQSLLLFSCCEWAHCVIMY